jgi:pimeloyl-ACP methyl ester carboxylesterase
MRESTFVTKSGLTLNHFDSGGDGPVVVFLHGVTRRWQDWLSVIPHLTPGWRCIAIDARGHGRSGRTPGQYRICDYVPDYVDFLNRGLSDPAIVVGHSLGGNLAAALAGAVPERVRGVVLEDPPLWMAGPRLAETPFLANFRVFIEHAGSQKTASEIAREMSSAMVPFPGKSELVRMGSLRDLASLRFSGLCLKLLDPEVLRCPLEDGWLEGSDIDTSLRNITAPTLLLQSDLSMGGILPDAEADQASKLISDCAHIKLVGMGHNIHTGSPETFLKLLIPFLSSLD